MVLPAGAMKPQSPGEVTRSAAHAVWSATMSDTPTTTLWRPVGQAKLDLIAQSDYGRFPPRLPEQPIFYPVCNEAYACEIAEKWNAPEKGVGFVTRFEVRSEFLADYERHIVGARRHEEYWIPAEDLDAFNDAIVGEIRVVKEFRRSLNG